MPFHRPIPKAVHQPRPSSSGMQSWVEAEKLMQIALLLPSAAFIGWLGGALLDKWLHQTWIGLAGIVFGGISGLIYVIRLAMATESTTASKDESADQADKIEEGDHSIKP